MASDTLVRRSLTVICILFVLGIGAFYYQFTIAQQDLLMANKLLRDDVQKLDTKVTEKTNALEQSDVMLADVIARQRDELQGKITTVENKSAAGISQVQSQLAASEAQNKKLIADLEKDLGQKIQNLNVQSTDFSSIIGTVVRSVVSVATDRGQGSGVFVYRAGYIITNYHVVEGAQALQVLTYDGKVHPAATFAFSSNLDLAVLKIQDESYPLLPLANSDSAQVGEKVIAVGNPGGLGFTVTEGIVSAVNRAIFGSNYIQTDVPINPGNSGGPIINTKSEVLGINTFKISSFEGIGFAIPSNVVKNSLDQIFAQVG